MKLIITPKEVTIRELIKGYTPSETEVKPKLGYDGKLVIRPAYQREFIYDTEEEQQAVIETILDGYPLNSMYWADSGNGTYELLDGQQRTLSICRFCKGVSTYKDGKTFEGMAEDDQTKVDNILNYKLQVYVVQGSNGDKLEWFKRINTNGKPLNIQELLNATHTGPWLTSAKKEFSSVNGAGFGYGSAYTPNTLIINRQELLHHALKWITSNDTVSSNPIKTYMGKHQADANAQALLDFFTDTIDWVNTVFPDVYTNTMKSINWGSLYYKYGTDTTNYSAQANALLSDPSVERKAGIYEYLLSGGTDTKLLKVRVFNQAQKETMYQQQGGKCANPACKSHKTAKVFALKDMEADHVTAWSKGGATNLANGQMLCKPCNRAKGNV